MYVWFQYLVVSFAFFWPASFGLFACLDFGPCPLFLFLSLSWVLSFYEVWQVSSSLDLTQTFGQVPAK